MAPYRADEAERWAVDAGTRDVAVLDIPAHASRDRNFEVWCSFTVRHLGGATARHGLKVLVDGAQQWARRADTHPGPGDSLEVRFRRQVPCGQPLRLTAVTDVQGAARLSLRLSAEEE